MSRRERVCRSKQEGIALITALLLVLTMSMLAAGLMVSTQSEIWTTANYNSSLQARYVAEAGAQQTGNWINNYFNSNLPDFSDSKWNFKVFPVTYNDQPVLLTTAGFKGSGDKSAALGGTWVTARNDFAATLGSTAALNNGVFSKLFASNGSGNKFETSVQLLQAYVDQVDLTANRSTRVLKWKVVSQGTVSSPKLATVQIVEVMTQEIVTTTKDGAPKFVGAVYASGTGCGAVTLGSSGTETGSYDSRENTNPDIDSSNGDVWSAGNIQLFGGASIFGDAYTPGSINTDHLDTTSTNSTKRGAYQNTNCDPSETPIKGVTTNNGSSDVKGTDLTNTRPNIVKNFDPSTMNMPAPEMPSVPANTSNCTSCTSDNKTSVNLAPNPTGNYGNVSVKANDTLILSPGVYNVNCLDIAGNAKVQIPSNGTVVINILDKNGTCAINLNGGSIANANGTPQNLQINYAGTGTITLNGNADFFGTIYAPNANVNYNGGFKTYGAIVCKTISITGGGDIYYDRALADACKACTGPTCPCNSGLKSVSPKKVYTSEYSWSAY